MNHLFQPSVHLVLSFIFNRWTDQWLKEIMIPRDEILIWCPVMAVQPLSSLEWRSAYADGWCRRPKKTLNASRGHPFLHQYRDWLCLSFKWAQYSRDRWVLTWKTSVSIFKMKERMESEVSFGRENRFVLLLALRKRNNNGQQIEKERNSSSKGFTFHHLLNHLSCSYERRQRKETHDRIQEIFTIKWFLLPRTNGWQHIKIK